MKSVSDICDLYRIGLLQQYKLRDGYLLNNVQQDDSLHVDFNHGRVYYYVHTGHNNIYVYYGYYGPLNSFEFKNKTNARRFIQQQMRLVEFDILFLQDEVREFRRNPGFVQWIPETQMQINKVTKRMHELESALLSPNISHRAHPRFRT